MDGAGIAIVIGIGFVVIIMSLGVYASRVKKVGPNEVLIISGRGKGEKAEARKENSRFRRENNTFKTVDQVVHEKMAELPFVELDEFDIATFVAYGTKYYDKMIPGSYGKRAKKPEMGEQKKKPTSRPRRTTSRPRS